jgi:hypothetical protein
MEIEITAFVKNAAPMDYCASVAQIGEGAGRATWQAAVEDSEEYPLLGTEEARDAFRDHIRGFGAWDADEIAAMSDAHLNALCIQMVAGDLREVERIGWDKYERKCAAGDGGPIYRQTVQVRHSYWDTETEDYLYFYYIGD